MSIKADVNFILREVIGTDDLAKASRFEDFDQETIAHTLDMAEEFLRSPIS